jgi:hypothetical protein
MATNLKQKRKKLYFDLSLSRAVTNVVVPCTQYTSGTVPGDRYGGLLDAYPAVQGGAQAGEKAKLAVSAWFQPNSFGGTVAAGVIDVMFVGPTAAASGIGAIPRLKYLTGTAGGGITAVNALSGHEAIYSITAGIARHFAVKVHRNAVSGIAATISGTLYVQRQHSIEV